MAHVPASTSPEGRDRHAPSGSSASTRPEKGDAFVDTSRRAGRREWIGLAVIALPCLLYSMDLTILYLAVPKLSAGLQPSSSQLLWITDIYGFLLAGCLITMGTLGDRIGRRRLLLIGAAVFGAASIVAAFSTTAEMLIAARALLGIAAATLAPSTLSLIRNMFVQPDQRTVAIAVWIMSFSVGAAIGPLVGGAILQHFWWGSVFLATVPVMALLLVLGPLLLPEFRDPNAGHMDLPSVGLSLWSVLAVIYGLKQTAQEGPGWVPALAVVAGLAAGIAFLRRQRSLRYPLLDVRLFRFVTISISVASMCASVFVVSGIFLFTAQHLQLVLGMGPMTAALWLLPSTGGFVAGSILAPRLAPRVPPTSIITGGLALAAAGVAALTRVDADSGLAVVVGGISAMGLGAGLVGTLATDVVVGAAPAERAGAASAITETGAELGGALGIAILGSIHTAVYRAAVIHAIPGGVPREAAAQAQDTLGGAIAAAKQLRGKVATDLVDVARDAFTRGLRVAAATTVVLVGGLAMLVGVVLRGRVTGELSAD